MIISDLPNSNTLCNPDALSLQQVGMCSYRTNWEILQTNQPAGGVPTNNPSDASYNWSFFDSAVAQAAAYGKLAWLRVNIQSASSPDWIQSLSQQYIAAGTGKAFNIWWDPYFQSYLIAMIQAAGTRYASNSVVSVVTFNIASDNVGDWTVPNVAASTSPTGAGNWVIQNSFSFPAYNASVTVTPTAHQQVHTGWIGTITGFGWIQITGFTGPNSNPTSVTIMNLGISGNATGGTVSANSTVFVSDIANLTGPVYNYTTSKFLAALDAVHSAAHTAFPNQVLDQEVGRSGTLDPFPASTPPGVSTPVQETIGTASGSNPYTLAFTSNVTAGNSLFAAVHWNSNLNSVTSFTDSVNGSAQWSPVALIQQQNRSLTIYGFNNTAGGACTVSVTLASTQGLVHIALFELGGAHVIVDVQASGHASAVTSFTTPTIIPSFSNELVLAAAVGDNPLSGEAGWTFQSAGNMGTQYNLPGSAAPIAASFSQALGGYVAIILAFSGAEGTYGTTYRYNAATQMAQWAYANLPKGSYATEKDTINAGTSLPAVALANQDNDSFYLPAQIVPGSTNTSGTTGTIPKGSLLYLQQSWPCYDVTGTYSPSTTASSASGPYTANGGKPYSNPIPVLQEIVKLAQEYGATTFEMYEEDVIHVLPYAGSYSGNTNAFSAQANFSSQQALTACRSTPGGP